MQTDRTRLVLGGKLPPLQTLTPSAAAACPCWELTFLCDGKTFKAVGRARNAQAAAAEAVIELASQFGDFDHTAARLVASVQVH